MTTAVVAALMLHNQTCARCQAGSPCLAAEQVQDEWLHQVAPAPQVADEPTWLTANAA
jgi:hypothetical protein